MAPAPEAQAAIEISVRLCCVGIALQAAELLALAPELRDRHLLGWRPPQHAPNFFRRLAHRVQGYPANLGVLAARVLLAGICVALPGLGGGLDFLLLGMLFLSQLHFNRGARQYFANSDHVNLFCLAGLTVATLPGASDTLRALALAFITFQACLGYVASGLDKLLVARWCSGRRLVHVCQDSSHRVPWLGRLLGRFPPLAQLLTWGVILLELGFPFCLVMPERGFWIFVVAGLLFHGSIALLMALPGFFWAFAATYPAMYVVREWLGAWPSP